jgi:hypothetical protein
MVLPIVDRQAALGMSVDPSAFDQCCDQASWLAATATHSRLDALIAEFADVPLRREFSGEVPEQLQATDRIREIDS